MFIIFIKLKVLNEWNIRDCGIKERYPWFNSYHQYKDEVGKQYGRLTVIKKYDTNDGKGQNGNVSVLAEIM